MDFRPFMLAVLMPSVVACGGEEEGNVVPEGPHYHYVVDSITLPTTNTQSKEFGIDLDGKGSKNDNALGSVLATLKGFGFEVQPTIDQALAEGSILLLADFQTESFSSTTKAGIQVYLGDSDTLMPAACDPGEMYDEVAMTGCGNHLVSGVGMFNVASDPDAALGGKIINGNFTGGPGKLTLQIALGGTMAIELNLIGARAKGNGIDENKIGSMILAGAIPKTDIDTKVIPAIHTQLVPIIEEDCPMPDVAGCGCMAESTGKTILGLLDTLKMDGTMGQDCRITADEIAQNPTIASILQHDVEIDGVKALSLGIKATAVQATFTVPGQM